MMKRIVVYDVEQKKPEIKSGHSEQVRESQKKTEKVTSEKKARAFKTIQNATVLSGIVKSIEVLKLNDPDKDGPVIKEAIEKISSIVEEMKLDFKKWLNETEDQYFILIKDTTDFDLVQHWIFDWNTIVENIPYDWDCIQLGFENISIIPFYLHPILPSHTFGPSLINRYYAKKIIKLHCFDGKYKLYDKINY